jgi:hypothetical protein
MFTASSSAEVGSGWSCNSTPPVLLHGMYRGVKLPLRRGYTQFWKKMTLEYIKFLLKNKSKKTYRKGRLNPPSELDRRVRQ